MASNIHVAFRADDRSYFAILKKEIHAMAVQAGFSERKVGVVDIIVAELVSNLVKHAGGGQIFAKLLEPDPDHGTGIELITTDSGPGMTDVRRMITDGVSTKNTLGHGLGSIKRLSDFFDIYSQKEWGTIALARVFAKSSEGLKNGSKTEIRSVILPKPGETACGDGFFHFSDKDHLRLMLGDGLGHGVEAEKAVTAAGEAFLRCEEQDPVEIIRYMNASVKKTRGLVATLAVCDLKKETWRICGVGNIATRVSSPSMIKNYTSYNGIIGLNVPNTLNAQVVTAEKGQYIIMCSDGLRSRWDPLRYPGIFRYDLSLLSACLIKDYARNTDDMSVAACKLNL